MLTQILSIFAKPLEWHIYGMAIFVVSILYLQIVIAPVGILVLLSFVAFEFVEVDLALVILGISVVVGLGLGIWWAEKVRRTHGVITFHAYLLSTPEIEGWRDSKGRVVGKR